MGEREERENREDKEDRENSPPLPRIFAPNQNPNDKEPEVEIEKRRQVFANFEEETRYFMQHFNRETRTVQREHTESTETNAKVTVDAAGDLLGHYFPKYVENNRKYLEEKYPTYFKKDEKGNDIPLTNEQINAIFNQEAIDDETKLIADLKLAMSEEIPIENNFVLETGNIRGSRKTTQLNNDYQLE